MQNIKETFPVNLSPQTSDKTNKLWKIGPQEIQEIRGKMLFDGKLPSPQTFSEKKKYNIRKLFLILSEESLFTNVQSSLTKVEKISQASSIFISTNGEVEKAYKKQEISDEQFEMATIIIKHQYEEYIKKIKENLN